MGVAHTADGSSTMQKTIRAILAIRDPGAMELHKTSGNKNV